MTVDLVHWVRPELVAEVKYLTWTDENLLRQVVYEGLREDKPAAEVRVEDLAGLLGLVEIGLVEIHPWGAIVDDIEHPDMLVFDLDPGEGVGWEFIVETAFRLRDTLADEGARVLAKDDWRQGLARHGADQTGTTEPCGPRLGVAAQIQIRRNRMPKLTRRSLLRSSVGLVTAGTLGRPYIADAAAKTATVWWVQGFAEEEDAAFKNTVAGYEKASSNRIDYTLIPFAPHRQKIVSAVTSGDVPDLFPNNPVEILALYAWDNKLVDVTDVVETQKAQYTETALLTAFCYNGVEKRRSYYAVPYTCAVRPNHIWRPLIENAGYKIEDAPKSWDAYYDFFKEVQKKLRAEGTRHVYGMGFQLNTTGNDSNALFDYFLIAYGGKDIVTKDGKLHADDPQVKDAAIKAVTYPTTAYKEGFVPPGAINWNDADDNNAFHAKQIVMDLDGTISTEVAIIKNKQDYDDIETMGLALSNDGKPVPSEALHTGGVIPKGAKNVDVAKDFLKFLIQPEVLNAYLKAGLGRNIPCMPSIAKNDPWWLADPHRAAYTKQGLLGPTVPNFWVFNPAYASVENTHVWPTAWADVINGGMTAEAAVEKAFKRAEEIFAKYPIVQA